MSVQNIFSLSLSLSLFLSLSLSLRRRIEDLVSKYGRCLRPGRCQTARELGGPGAGADGEVALLRQQAESGLIEALHREQ